jgi:hypothetical protein
VQETLLESDDVKKPCIKRENEFSSVISSELTSTSRQILRHQTPTIQSIT